VRVSVGRILSGELRKLLAARHTSPTRPARPT
jgi:hypothetical protein